MILYEKGIGEFELLPPGRYNILGVDHRHLNNHIKFGTNCSKC